MPLTKPLIIPSHTASRTYLLNKYLCNLTLHYESMISVFVNPNLVILNGHIHVIIFHKTLSDLSAGVYFPITSDTTTVFHKDRKYINFKVG